MKIKHLYDGIDIRAIETLTNEIIRLQLEKEKLIYKSPSLRLN